MGKNMMIVLLVVLVVAVIALVLVGLFALYYNRLVRLRNTGDQAWSDIDVQLQRRYDLIPNLVETVKGYAAHEKTTLENVIKARQQAVQITGDVEKKAEAENMLTQALRQLFAVAEAYPQIKANENFMTLQNQLAEIEEQIQLSRRYYNAVVRDYNNAVQSFPSNVVASVFGFKTRQYFEIEEPSIRQAPKVQF